MKSWRVSYVGNVAYELLENGGAGHADLASMLTSPGGVVPPDHLAMKQVYIEPRLILALVGLSFASAHSDHHGADVVNKLWYHGVGHASVSDSQLKFIHIKVRNRYMRSANQRRS